MDLQKPINKLRKVRTHQLHYMLEEMKFIKSKNDLWALYQKFSHFFFRILKSGNHHTPVPYCIQIEPTNFCNANCLCCARQTSKRPVGYMKMPLFDKIIQEAAAIGVQRVDLYLLGEPLFHPHICEMVQHCKANHLPVHLTTNGMLLDKDMSDAFLHSGMDRSDRITFSILGASSEVHELIQPGLIHSKIVQNVEYLIKARRQLDRSGPVIETMFYTMPQNQHEEKTFIQFWQNKVDHARLGGKIRQAFAEYGLEKQQGKPRRFSCNLLWERLPILWDGRANLCNQDVDAEFVLGDLNQISIKNAWNSPTPLHVKEIHRRGEFSKFPICTYCDW